MRPATPDECNQVSFCSSEAMSDTHAIDDAIQDFEHRLEMVERWLGDPKTWEFANTPYDRDALVRQKEVLTERLPSLRGQMDNPPQA